MCTEAPKDAAHFRAGPLRIGATLSQVRRPSQLLADIAINEAAQTMIAIHDALESFDVTDGLRPLYL